MIILFSLITICCFFSPKRFYLSVKILSQPFPLQFFFLNLNLFPNLFLHFVFSPALHTPVLIFHFFKFMHMWTPRFFSSTLTAPHTATGTKTHFLSNRRNVLPVIFALSLICFAFPDDTQALRNTLNSLCSLNRESEFSSCCSMYPPSTVSLTPESEKQRRCYFAKVFLSPHDSLVVTGLFVSILMHISLNLHLDSGNSTLLD